MGPVPLLLALVLSSQAAGDEGAQAHAVRPEDVPAELGIVPAPESPLGLADSRMGSGTAWLPDSSPMYAGHWVLGRWSLMAHGNLFAGFDVQGLSSGGPSTSASLRKASAQGERRFASINWVMGMARHPLFGGEFGARAMLSLEPLTVGGRGYPLLLQTGETFQGAPLHDRQHPHDLFMELAVMYARALGDAVAFQVYLAPAGEPALGPVAYPHRLSALSNPFAPIGHHWQDSTHISFGVLTAGLFTRWAKVEGSWFNGREPDENRWDIDLRAPDSWSARVWVQPWADANLQASYGHLGSPEAAHPGAVDRLTASATWNRRLARGNWATTLAWGRNWSAAPQPPTDAVLLESDADLDGHWQLVGRIEAAFKSGEELVLPAAEADRVFPAVALNLGCVYLFGPFAGLTAGVGAVGTLDVLSAGLEPFYGTRPPIGGFVFVQLRPAVMRPMNAMGYGMHMPGMQ